MIFFSATQWFTGDASSSQYLRNGTTKTHNLPHSSTKCREWYLEEQHKASSTIDHWHASLASPPHHMWYEWWITYTVSDKYESRIHDDTTERQRQTLTSYPLFKDHLKRIRDHALQSYTHLVLPYICADCIYIYTIQEVHHSVSDADLDLSSLCVMYKENIVYIRYRWCVITL